MERLDIVNEKDEVVGSALREEIYAKKHLHRIVHVLIFNDQGEMALQYRSPRASYFPNAWATAVGGHVRSGETYEQAALREMQEEVGVTIPMEFFAHDLYENEQINKFLTTFKAESNGPFIMNDPAVARIEFFTLERIQKLINEKPLMHPELLFILKRHFGIA